MDELEKLVKGIQHHRDDYYYIVEYNKFKSKEEISDVKLLLKVDNKSIENIFGLGIVENAYIELDTVYSFGLYHSSTRNKTLDDYLIDLEVLCNEYDVKIANKKLYTTIYSPHAIDVFVEFVNGTTTVFGNSEWGSLMNFDEYVD